MSHMVHLDASIEDLRRIEDADVTLSTARAEAARLRRVLEALRERAAVDHRRLIFIGPPSVGKSSVLAALARLYVGEPPRTPAELRDRAILPIGSGKTTAFGLVLRTPMPNAPVGRILLDIDPVPHDDVRRILEPIAEGEILTRDASVTLGERLRPDPLATELRRVVLNMCGYEERTEIYFEGNLKRTRTLRPLDEYFRGGLPTVDSLTDHLLNRLNLETRTQTSWHFSDDDTGRSQLKRTLGQINLGLEPVASLPRRIVLSIPSLGDGRHTLPLELADTRGLEGGLAGRADVLDALREPDAVLVLCSPFGNAPGAEAREVLLALGRDLGLRDARARVCLLIVDKSEADGVVDAAGLRESGQITRAEDCWRTLRAERLDEGLSRSTIQVFDPLLDDPKPLLDGLNAASDQARARLDELIQQALDDASALLESDEGARADNELIDEHLRAALRTHRPVGEPLQDPLAGLRIALSTCPYAARIRATIRWDGHYENLHLFRAIEVEARVAATDWLRPLDVALSRALNDLESDQTSASLLTRLAARRRALRDGLERTVSDYGGAVRKEAEQLALRAPVWNEAWDEWGRGKGYRDRVLDRFIRWGTLQPFSAHLSTTLTQHLPLLAALDVPDDAPGVTLCADRFRRLRHLRWSVQGVALLVGANGAGKTTTLSLLRFFSAAFARGADAAASEELAAHSNPRTWGEPETEPVRLAIEHGETRWEFELRPMLEQRGCTVRERLTIRDEEVFSFNESRRLVYRGTDLGMIYGSDCGLAHLTRLNKTDLAVRRMARLAEGLHSYRVPNLHVLKAGGTRPLPERPLESTGGNAFSVLQRLREPGNGDRYSFVLETLKLAFPGLVDQLAFHQTETAVELSVLAPGQETPNYIGLEADGVLQLIVQLVAIASAEPGEVVALDQPDDHLHPYAVRVFLRQVERWARQHRITVILATHSIVLLDAMKRTPEQVFVMRPNREGRCPNALTELYERSWLDAFELGELYKNDEIGSNVDDA